MSYTPIKVELLEVVGLAHSFEAMRLPIEQHNSKKNDWNLASTLIKAGSDHAKFQRGILAYIKIEMQTGFMIEFETYRHGIEVLSTSSSMHNELKHLRGEELAAQKQRDLQTKVYTRILTMSYQSLRSIYKARRVHRHPDWQLFCNFIELLPYFTDLIYPEYGA